MVKNPMIYLIMAVNILFLILLYIVMDIPGVKASFVVFHVFGMLTVSIASAYFFLRREGEYFNPRDIFFKAFMLALFLFIALVSALILGIPYGSIILVFIIAFLSGSFAFLLLRDHRETRTKIVKTSNLKPALLVFLLGFFLRFLVFGLSSIPIGYDTPRYLLVALRGSETPLLDLLFQGLSFSSSPYQDTWDFSSLWLGASLKFFGSFDLDATAISKILMPFISSLSIIALYFLVKALTDNEKIAIWSSFFFAVLPGELIFSDLYKEIFGELWVIVALYFFVMLVKKSSKATGFFFLLSLLFLWKTAITAFAKLVMFLFAYGTYLTLNKEMEIRKAGVPLAIFGVALLACWMAVSNPFSDFLLTPVKVGDVGAYTRYAFPIIALTNLTAFLLILFYFLKAFVIKGLSREEKSALSFSVPLFLSLFMFSFLISGLQEYRIFPSSTLLNSLRFSLYMDIPLAIMAGLFMYNVTKIDGKKIKAIVFIIVFFAFMDFTLAAYGGTTVHENRLKPYIDEATYKELNSLTLNEYDYIICLGNFTWTPNTSNFAFGNWIKYIVYSKTRKEPTLIESLDEIGNMTFQEGKTYLLLDLFGQELKEAFVYDSKKGKFLRLKEFD